MAARRARVLVVALAVVVALSALGSYDVSLAAFRGMGAGGCGTLDEALTGAQPGDVLSVMRGGVNSNSAAVTSSIALQGGWLPDTGDCNSNGDGSTPKRVYASAAEMLAAGFVYDPAERSELFGDFNGPVLTLDLSGGKTAALQNLAFGFYSINTSGAAITAVLSDSARLRLENLRFEGNQVGVNGVGGAVSIQVRGGSHLTIVDSEFSANQAFSGGALRVELFDNSTLLVEGSSFSNNEAIGGDGGALEVVIHSGSATVRRSTFTNNVATNGGGAGVRIERAPDATGEAYALLEGNSFAGNSAAQDIDVSLDGVALITPRQFLPLAQTRPVAPSYAVSITGIVLDGATYRASFSTAGYTPQLPGRHIHFFFNTVPPGQAGMPGAGPWRIYGGASPFTQYGIANRPAGATHLCALVANADHSVIQGSGDCAPLP
jgi:hypothetical protein